jgi:NADH:ubiquinone oxidoreductase subunit H
MEQVIAREGYELWRPNREKPQAKTMKAVIAFVLLVSAALLIVITLGGWDRLLGTSVAVMSLLWAVIYIVFAVLVMRWSRGVLPVPRPWR